LAGGWQHMTARARISDADLRRAALAAMEKEKK
jgi:hypothetical protein